MRRQTAILLLPLLATGAALLYGRRRSVPALRVTRADGHDDVVRTSSVLAILTSRAQAVVAADSAHLPMCTLWISTDSEPMDVLQSMGQFRQAVEEFIELETSTGPVLINPSRVSTIKPSGQLTGPTPEQMYPTTRITFEGGRSLIVHQSPERTAAMLGRAA